MQHQHFVQQVKKRPQIPTTLAAAHGRLVEAEKFRRAGDLAKAQAICESLLNEFPEYVGALQTLGAIHLARKNYWPALSCFTKAAMRSPRDWINLTNLAAVYVGLDARELATITLDQARRLKPDDAEIHYTMGEIYRDQREYELAVSAYERALQCDSGHAHAAHGLGESYTNLGRYAEAVAAHERVHALRPDSVTCLYGLAQLPASMVNIDVLQALENLHGNKKQHDEDFHTQYAFAMGSALDRKGRHKEAWEKLLEANRLEFPKHEIAYRKQLPRQTASRQVALDQPPLSAPPAKEKDVPLSLFITGVSRSGKTTLEYLVSTLDSAKRGYESHLVEHAIQRASQNSGLLTLSNPNELPRSLDGVFRQFYLEELREVGSAAKIFTNTSPGAIHAISRLATALPNSRFVFVKRDRNDIALRILGRKYKTGNHYAYDLKTIFDYITWYNEMIDLWCAKLPAITRVIQYEDMISNPAASLKVVADLCGLPMPDSPLPKLGDDRGCATPYREMIDAALR